MKLTLRVAAMTPMLCVNRRSVSVYRAIQTGMVNAKQVSFLNIIIESPHDKTNKVTAPSEDSDQSGHPVMPRLI